MKNFKSILSKPSRESKPWAMWIWNLNISRQELKKQLNSLIQKGFGGIAIRPGRNMAPAYLSEEFLDNFGYVLETAQHNGVGVRLADDLSLSWSGAFDTMLNQNRKFRAEYLVLDQQISPSTESGDCEIVLEPHREYFAQAVRMHGKTVSLKEVKQVQVPSGTSVLHWKAPGSGWKLLLFKKELVRDFAGGFIPNVMNQKIAQAYIQNTLEVLKNRFSKYIPTTFEGFITEMPNLNPGAGAIPWDDDLVVKYRTKFKKDLLKLLPALFFEADSMTGKFRVQIHTFIYSFMCERFASALEAWAKKYRLSQWVLWGERGMYRPENSLTDCHVLNDPSIGSFGYQNVDGTLDSYALLRTVSDVNTNEYRRETVTVIGRNRIGIGNTIQSFKREMDLSLMGGSSRIILDGFFFNIDQRNYYKTPCNPAWYSPEWKHMKSLCDYSSRAQEMLKELHSVREVAVLSPSSSIISQYVPSEPEAVSRGLTQLQKTIDTVARLDIGYDMVTEELLLSCTQRANGEFGTADRIRKGNYQALIIPFAPCVSRSLLVFIEKLVAKGTIVIFIDEPIQGTCEDGVSAAVTARVQKLINKTENVFVSSVSELEQALLGVKKEVSVLKESGIHADVVSSAACGEGYKIYTFHNLSDSTEQSVTIELPFEKHFAAIDCANGRVFEIENVESTDTTSKFKFCFSPLQTVMIASSSSKITAVHSENRDDHHALNPFALPQRNYRIVFKDQWSFEPRSMNVLPLANWNVRIGLSKESGQFSHFYETTFDIKSVPEQCMFLLSGFGQCEYPDSFPEQEISINGSRIQRASYSDGSLEVENAATQEDNEKTKAAVYDCTLQKLFGENVCFYNIRQKIVRGLNRISIRTTGSVTDPQPLLYPPLVMGSFSISKGPHGWTLDRPSAVVGHDSWTKYGYPYLSGRAVYRQFFEVPSEYKKLILRFSQVSGTVYVKVNDKNLGSFQWHPMEIDITPFCSSKRNELSIEVVNTVDNVLRMNGRPSGLTGEVFIDVY
ncbi:MAG: hypothetical protein ACLFVQ_04785 [Chitinispirillaceae bacterium]